MSQNHRGQILVGVTILVMILMILVPIMVQWSTDETKWAVKDQQTNTTFNLAEGTVDRGMWKLKSATGTWAAAAAGTVIPGYNLDTIYTDVVGAEYRLRFSSGPLPNQVTVFAEARDLKSGQVRALRSVFENRAIPGPILSGGLVSYAGTFDAHWGPIMAQGNIQISGTAATRYSPRKFSKQVVTGTAGNPRDTSGMNPPNTNNIEWWSDYPVPDLPIMDFTTMRASATAMGTLNYRTNNNASGAGKCVGWAGQGRCQSGGNTAASHFHATTCHFFNSNNHAQSKSNRLWYWDNDLIMSGNMGGPGCYRLGLYGPVIVRGNMTIDSGDCYACRGPVPANAWKEYTKITAATNDTAALNQYPADNGLRTNRATFSHGGETWAGGPIAGNTDVGIRGFIYVGGNMTFNSLSDVGGAIWVVGNVINNDVSGERVNIYYEPNFNLPLLNVVLGRMTWDEVTSTSPW
ncbi:MAG: pilus assembly PilX N-terminal domain-containing protein [Elusimicrobia bacterium]|nr:pilus assembly PilX N-terminal domain-containing protein [Elusimicrobiota bacterium]